MFVVRVVKFKVSRPVVLAIHIYVRSMVNLYKQIKTITAEACLLVSGDDDCNTTTTTAVIVIHIFVVAGI